MFFHSPQHVRDGQCPVLLYWKGILSWLHFDVQGRDILQEKERNQLIKLSYIVQVSVDQCLLKVSVNWFFL